MASTDLNAIENSIQALVVQATTVSGFTLAGDHVIWQDQDRDRPSSPLMSLFLEETRRIGVPEQTVTNTPGAPAGNEITLTSRTPAEFRLNITCVSNAKVSTGSEPSAVARLHALGQALETETLTSAFEAAGLTLVRVGVARSLPRVLETQFEGRATLPVEIRISDEITETTTFIESAQSVGTYNTP